MRMVDGLDNARRDRNLLAAVRERHHVGDTRGSVKYKHGILLVTYRTRATSPIITETGYCR
jgi:chorismate mutase